jgi:hypothetical protein
MHKPIFMYGDMGQFGEEEEPVLTVLLIGFDGRRKILTGVHDVLWHEFMHGDGGQSNDNTPDGHVGYEYWCQLPLGTTEDDQLTRPVTLQLLNRGIK